MLQPGLHTEIETYAGYIEVQLESLRESAFGLSEEQARMTPCRSALSIGGLLKHVTYVIEGRARRTAMGGVPSAEDFEKMCIRDSP